MRKISSTVVGIPLRQTSPAAIERFLVQKVRDDLGEFSNLAVIKPAIRVDKEDGDLSGNITDGFGNVMLDVSGVKVHIPFIIHQKELLPFDVIRMGDQEVTYDISKLRRIVNGIDKKIKEKSEDESLDGPGSEIANPKDVPSHNGFLGSIMRIRDSHSTRDVNGVGLWDGMDFGTMDDFRLGKQASADVDVMEVFEDAVEKIASVKVYDQQAVDLFLEDFEKRAEEAAEGLLKTAAEDVSESFDKSKVQREMAKLDERKLVDVGRVKSGNDIKFPVSIDASFEYRNGRVYHKLQHWGKDEKRFTPVTNLKSIVLDSKGGYKFLRSNDNFMTTLDAPSNFKLHEVEAKSLETGKVYAVEIDTETLSYPFSVSSSYRKRNAEEGLIISVPERAINKSHTNDFLYNTLFVDSFDCSEILPSKSTEHDYVTTRDFTIVVSRKNIDKVVQLDEAGLREYIQLQADDHDDAKLAARMAAHYSGICYIVPQSMLFFELSKNILGYFKRPDGLFTETPFTKTAAFNNGNYTNLIVEKSSKPRLYAVEFQYTDEISGDTTATSYNLKKHKFSGLSEMQARKMLSDLGYDERQKEMFFEIVKRNGRNARFDLSDATKAKQLAPSDKAKSKTKTALGNIINSTLNARNFTPIFSDVISDGLTGMVSNAVPNSIEWVKKWDDLTKTSYETALEVEKIATQLNGPTWHELAMLTNLKHRLDKMASEVWKGAYLHGTEEVFEKVASLQPAIEKQAQNLISFNRQQILNYDKAPVDPRLVKQAVAELDGLSRYACVHEVLKKNDFLSKEAGFFNTRKVLKADIADYGNRIGDIRKELDNLQYKYRDSSIYLRSLQGSKKNTADKELKVQGQLNDLKDQIMSKVDDLNVAVGEKNLLEGSIRSQNLGIGAAVGLPGLAAMSYGYQDLKNK
jgi:hypothetical protein